MSTEIQKKKMQVKLWTRGKM